MDVLEKAASPQTSMQFLSPASLHFQPSTRSSPYISRGEPCTIDGQLGQILIHSKEKILRHPSNIPCKKCQCFKCSQQAPKRKMQDISSQNASILPRRQLYLSRAKLKASSRTSALLSGFAMVALVELQLNEGSKIPSSLLVAFSVCTTLLVAIHLLALMISTCILPHVEAVSEIHSDSAINESPHRTMHCYIEVAWASSTVFGIFLFLIEIVMVCWVKFFDYSFQAAWAATAVLLPILVIFFAFAVHFSRKLVGHKYQLTESGIRELEDLKNKLESANLDNPSTPFTGNFV